MSDLIVIGYPEEETAERARGELLKLQEDFRQRVQDIVTPGTSAILVIKRNVTTDTFLEALRPYGGTVLQTSLPHDAGQQLMTALHSDDPAAPTWEQPSSAGATT